MRQRFRFLLAPCLLAALIMPVLAAGAKTQTVYTWVDKHGVRHYADYPGSPNAKLLSLAAPAPVSMPGLPASAPPQSSAPRPASAAPAAESPAARCKRLRDMVKRLQSARRVRVTENGKSRYVSGEDLVKFKAQLAGRMQKACAPQSGAQD